MSMMTTEQREKRQAEAAEQRRTTSIHEAGHAVVAQALGFVVNEVTIREGAGGGFCDTELPPRDSLEAIKRELSFVLAGLLAVAIERDAKWIGDWHGKEVIGGWLWNTIELEANSLDGQRGTRMRYCDYADAAERFLETSTAGHHWLDKALPTAADEAVSILTKRWGEVLGLAERLRRNGTVDLGETERRKRLHASIERTEIALARMRAGGRAR